MKKTLLGATALMAGALTGPAYAQQVAQSVATAQPADQIPAPTVEQASSDRVVVTGQLIAGASENAPSPVDSFTLGDLKDQGGPTAAEFLRALNISSEAAGEADSSVAGTQAGLATINLRGLGTGRTLVLLNGVRYDSGNGVADVNTLPSMVVGQVDVLKDGASVTYGAGAVGGVINYLTRKDVNGFELNVEKRFFDGSDGEENVEALWGLKGDASNILLGASYSKRHPLARLARSYSHMPPQEQPYSTFSSNPSQYRVTNPSTGATTSTIIRDYTPETCVAGGGVISGTINNASSTPNDCVTPGAGFLNLIDEEIWVRGYGEINADLSDTMELHVEVAYAKTDVPNVFTTPSLPNAQNNAQLQGGGLSIPYLSPTYSAAGVATANCVTTPSACTMNPYVEEFYNRAVATGRYSASGVRADLDIANYYQFRPVYQGGNDYFSGGQRSEKQQRERWGGSIRLSGKFTEDSLYGAGHWLPEDTTYEFTGSYNQYTQNVSRPDFVVSRLQNALNGYGGPACKAIDRVPTSYATTASYDATVGIQSDTKPGTNGCLYFNPFASSWKTNVLNGSQNAAYGGSSFENSPELLRWLILPRENETVSTMLAFNATFTGVAPGIELPGGAIYWAAGSNWRQTENHSAPRGTPEEIEIYGQHCPWADSLSLAPTTPGLSSCYADRGPFFGSGNGPLRPTASDRQILSFFGELQLPVFDNLNVQLAGRREEYAAVTGNIWKIAAKYDLSPELSFRGSYSTNFQAPPDTLEALGDIQGSAYISSLFRNVGTTTRIASGITPEDDKASNLGVIYSSGAFGGELRASLDFWEIVITKEVADTALTNVLQSVFNSTSPTATAAANCQAAFISLVTFSSPCGPTTTTSDLTNILRYTLNTGGYTENGVDISLDYKRDFGPGTLGLSVSGTNVLVYKVNGYNLPDGTPYQASYDGLGSANLTRNGTIMPRWRANGSVSYELGGHRVSLRANYFSEFRDDAGNTTIVGRTTAGDPIYPKFGQDPKDHLEFDLNYIYAAPFWQDLELRLSVLNLTDRDPLYAQHTNAAGVAQDTGTGYYPGYGNPRGRTFEVGITKAF